jgi:hypothetical protein
LRRRSPPEPGGLRSSRPRNGDAGIPAVTAVPGMLPDEPVHAKVSLKVCFVGRSIHQPQRRRDGSLGSLPTRSTMAKLPCLCQARLTLRREWCRLSAPTTSPLSLFLTETHSRASSSLGAGFQSSWQAPPLKSRIDWKGPQPDRGKIGRRASARLTSARARLAGRIQELRSLKSAR